MNYINYTKSGTISCHLKIEQTLRLSSSLSWKASAQNLILSLLTTSTASIQAPSGTKPWRQVFGTLCSASTTERTDVAKSSLQTWRSNAQLLTLSSIPAKM